MFTLLPQHAAKNYRKDWATWGGGWTWRIQWSVSKIKKKIVLKNKELRKDNWMTWKRKQANWKIESPRLSSSTKSTWVTAIEGSSVFRTWLGRRTNPTILKKRICQITRATWMHPCNVLEWNRFTERRWGVVWKEMMNCGIDGRARMEKRTRKKPNENKDETTP